MVVCIKRLLQVADLIERLEGKIESSLDTLDAAYRDISLSARTPALSDDPTVRRTITAIKSAQTAVLLVANELVSFGDEKS
jgi:hypothetical protein